MPPAAVIPAPVAYIKVAAVKKLVVEVLLDGIEPFWFYSSSICLQPSVRPLLVGHVSRRFTLRKSECFRQALAGMY